MLHIIPIGVNMSSSLKSIISRIEEIDNQISLELVEAIYPKKELWGFDSNIAVFGNNNYLYLPKKTKDRIPFDVSDPLHIFLTSSPVDYMRIFGGGTRLNEIKIF